MGEPVPHPLPGQKQAREVPNPDPVPKVAQVMVNWIPVFDPSLNQMVFVSPLNLVTSQYQVMGTPVPVPMPDSGKVLGFPQPDPMPKPGNVIYVPVQVSTNYDQRITGLTYPTTGRMSEGQNMATTASVFTSSIGQNMGIVEPIPTVIPYPYQVMIIPEPTPVPHTDQASRYIPHPEPVVHQIQTRAPLTPIFVPNVGWAMATPIVLP